MKPSHADPSRQNANVTLAVVSTAAIAYSVLQSLVIPALPDIQHAVGTTQTGVSWLLTGYLLSASVSTPLVGRLGDMYGKEKLLLVVLIILTGGTLLCAVSSSIGLLIIGRVIQGVGGGIFPLAFGIIRDEFPRDRVAGSIGMVSSLLGVGAGVGVVLAGIVVDNLSYHWLFWLSLIPIVTSAILTWLLVPESPIKSPARVNWLAAVLMAAGMTITLIAVSQTSSWGWGSPKTLGMIAVGIAVLCLWIAVELRSAEPLIDMRMMRIKGVWTTNVVALLIGVGMYASFILIPQFVELPTSGGFGFGASVTGAGLFLLPLTATMLVIGPFLGRLDHRFGAKLLLVAGSLLCAGCYLLLLVAHGSKLGVYVASAVLGLGIALCFASLANLIVQAVRQEQTGVATGMNTVMRTIGGALGGALVATVLTNSEVGGGDPSEHGFQVAYAVCLGALVLAAVVGLIIPGRGGRGAEQESSAPEQQGSKGLALAGVEAS